jgi:GTP cyclohydrolase I
MHMPLRRDFDASLPRTMPDIAAHAGARVVGTLDRVGMHHVELPVLWRSDDGELLQLPATADVAVNLGRAEVKGIHMSRLFLALQNALESEPLTPAMLATLLGRLVESHAGLSTTAEVTVRFSWLRKRAALRSDHRGWRAYPVELRAVHQAGTVRLWMRTQVLYSSTCPCSAALARQLIQERFVSDFADSETLSRDDVLAWLGTEEAICATPHSQRSEADVTVEWSPDGEALGIGELIDGVETVLQTAVQAAVKREDEQEFARRNGANLMFCEDAARRIKALLQSDPRVADWRVVAAHRESLHPHDAVATAVKGIEGGLRP